MKITKEEIIHVTRLSLLELTESEIDRFSVQVGEILDYIKKLDAVDTHDVTLTTHAVFQATAFREDIPHKSPGTEEGLSNAPQKEDGCFIVPKIVG